MTGALGRCTADGQGVTRAKPKSKTNTRAGLRRDDSESRNTRAPPRQMQPCDLVTRAILGDNRVTEMNGAF